MPRAHPQPLRGSAKLNISIKTGVSAELANSSKPFTNERHWGMLVRGAVKKWPPYPVTLVAGLKLGGDQLSLRIKQS